jgi:hypothetical protein
MPKITAYLSAGSTMPPEAKKKKSYQERYKHDKVREHTKEV